MIATYHEAYQALADSMNEMLYDQVAAASPVEVLSTHNDKLLQVIETPDGERLVTRSYTPKAVEEIEGNYGIRFRTAWEGMHQAFSDAGIGVVPSRLIETDGEYPFIVVSEYLEAGKPLATAPLETKKAAAIGLGKLLTQSACGYIPAPEMIRDDMFLVTERDGETTALVADVDPLVTRAHKILGSDQTSKYMFKKLAEMTWDSWCEDEDERKAVATALVLVLADYALDSFGFDSETAGAFMDLHLMSNGVDNRSTLS